MSQDLDTVTSAHFTKPALMLVVSKKRFASLACSGENLGFLKNMSGKEVAQKNAALGMRTCVVQVLHFHGQPPILFHSDILKLGKSTLQRAPKCLAGLVCRQMSMHFGVSVHCTMLIAQVISL